MVSGSLNIAESEFAISRNDGWMEIWLSEAARYVLRNLMKDAIRAASHRDDNRISDAPFFLISVFSRIAVAMSQSNTIHRISFEDIEALLWIQSLRTSRLGEHIASSWALTPVRSSPNSVDLVFVDMVAKDFEAVISD